MQDNEDLDLGGLFDEQEFVPRCLWCGCVLEGGRHDAECPLVEP